jgi:hypothetical protein
MIDMNAPTRGIPARALLAVLSSGIAVAACGRIPGQFEIVNDQVPMGGGCSIMVDETIYQGQGTLDLRIVRQQAESAYFFFPLIKNNLASSGSGADVNQIFLSSFAVDISPLAGVPSATAALLSSLNNPGSPDYALLHYKTPWSGSVGSGGKISAFVPAFPVDLAARILATQEIGLSPSMWVNLTIRAFGSTTTQDVESDPFNFPVALCAGCLVANVQPCPYTSAPANLGNPCNPAQDEFVDCCLSGTDLICPPSVSAQ